MIEVKINGVTKWQVNEYTFTDPQMGIRNITMTIRHPSMWVDGVAPEVADFTGAYVEYEGEQFYLSSSKPSAEKNTSTIDYTYTLVFKGSEDELTRRKVRDLAEAGVDNYVSQGTVFSIYANINQFVQLLQNNLNYYYENAWTINLAGTSQDSVRIDINNVFLWDLLQKTYEYFGLRFKVSGHTITIGYEPEEIYHVFDYGGDGGLINITRTAPDTSIVNRLSGTGGSRNVPVNYFSDTYSKFDPDPNPIAGLQRRITNIMPKVFGDSVRNGVLPYIDYVEDTQSILTHGVREDALLPNEDIYPSIAGVSVAGLGRIDEIVAVEVPAVSDPEAEGYVGTFDIWVKDIGFNLADDKYTTTEEATISFTTGYVTGYDFIILAINGVRQVVEDTTKSYNGIQSKYKITLIRSDAELAISDMMLPNQTAKPNAGDNFVIYNINMPQSYVENAEQRVQDWLESNLSELKVEKPSYTIQPMDSFFVTSPLEFDEKSIASKLKSGNRLTVNNTKITNGAQLLYINNVTIQYGGALPRYSFTVTDKVTVEGGAISRLQSQLDGVMGRQLLTEKDIDALLSGFSTKFLSKIKPDTAQQLIQFLNGISVNGLSHLIEGIEVGEYTQGFLGGGAALKMNAGISELEVDKLTVRMVATFFELVISKLTHIGGQLILTPARMKCINVVEMTDNYRCYFDTGDGKVANEFVSGDQARCQVFTGSGLKFYWRLVTAVGEDWIDLSKTDAVTGSSIPEAGDDIVQLGNRTDATRQNAQILSTVGADAPSWKQYKGVNTFSLEGKETTVFSGTGNKIEGTSVFTSSGENIEDEINSKFNNLRIGSVNLLRNTGFLGDFQSLDVDALTAVIAETPVATNEFAYWLQVDCQTIDAPSKSGKGARIGYLHQNTPILQMGETCTLTFWARGTTLTASIVEETIVPLTDEYKQYEMKIVIPETKVYIFTLSDATGTAEVYNIQLERGNRATDYNYSPEDDLKAISQFQAINVITSAIKEGNTDILGGLILTSMIQLGKYKDGVMERVNAGISGIWNSDDDPAMWAGGSFEQAIRTVQKIKENPSYNPTDEEWADMAKIVFTHGGDGFFRGYIYALGGIFRGKVETSISGNRIVIDPADKSLKMFNEAGAMALAMEFNEHPMGFNDARINVFTYNNEGEVMYNAQMMPTGVSIMYISQNDEVSIVNQATVNAREISILGYTSDGIDYNEQYKFEVTNNTIGDGSLRIRTTGMPTSSTGLMSGEWYVDGGAIKVKP